MQTTGKTKTSAGTRTGTQPADANIPKTRKAGPALTKMFTPSKDLAAVIGKDPVPRSQATKKVWDYIKAHNLQNPKKRTEIMADDKLRSIFGGKTSINMKEIMGLASRHLRPAA